VGAVLVGAEESAILAKKMGAERDGRTHLIVAYQRDPWWVGGSEPETEEWIGCRGVF
jgi:hypothetical protein